MTDQEAFEVMAGIWYGTRYEMWDGVLWISWFGDECEEICGDFDWIGYDSTLVGRKLEVPPKLKWI